MIRVAGPASPYDPTYHLLLRFDKIAEIVERERPDVLEVHSPYLAALGVMRAKRAHYGVRTFQWHSDFIDTYAGVLEAHVTRRLARGLPMLDSRVWSRGIGIGTKPLWGLVRSIARRCDATLVAADWQVAKLTAHGVPRVVRVPFGIEREIFRPDARSYEARREMLALASHDARHDDAVILVGVGRFAVEKRWDVVIDAFLRMRERDPRRDMILVLIGDGPERERMAARAAGSPDIVMPGFVKGREALARMLASADALVHGCPFETFGLSIAEAMSCGLPTVVPDEGGAAEMHVAAAGEQYRSLDVEDCVHATERLLTRLASDADVVRAAAVAAAGRLPNVMQQFEGQIALYEKLLEHPTQ
ncbi:MAG: alpha,6-mannosyltransferase [Myxococcales bacterium]|nr:alpha,6-mannosyltransferase [Myxococcales bacterium]